MSAKISAKRLANPALRSKIPTAQLPAKYRAMRAANTARATANSPSAVDAPLTPDTLNQQVKADTALYTAPAQKTLQDQQTVHNAMMGSIPSWYDDFLNAQKYAHDQTANAYAAAAAAQQNGANTSSALDQSQRSQQDASMQADAASRGATVDPHIAAVGQQAAASRRSQLDAQSGLTLGLGAAQTSYRAGQVEVAGAQKVKALEGEAARGRAIDSSAQDLATKAGQYAVTDKQKLIDADHTKQLENAAFGLKQTVAAADQKTATAKVKLAASSLDEKTSNDAANLSVKQGNLAVAQKRADAYVASQSKKGKPVSASVKATTGKARKDITYAVEQIPQMLKHRGNKMVPAKDKDGKAIPNKFVVALDANGKPIPDPNNKPTMADVRAQLEKKIPHDAVNAALKLLDKQKGGYLSAAQISGLRAAYPGISIGALGFQTENGRSRAKKTKVKPKATSVHISSGLKSTISSGGSGQLSKLRP